MEKFSVLMSIYEKENPKFFEQSLDSVLVKQTLIPDEVVIIQDGKIGKELSSIIKKFKSKFPKIIKVVPFEENRGLGFALQDGVKKCSNELICRMDTDDICDKNRFKKQISYMTKHKDISLCGGSIEEFDKKINDLKRLKTMPNSHDEIIKYSRKRNPFNHMTVCFKKSDILEVGNYQSLQYLEDHYLWIRLLASGKKTANLKDVLVYARIGNGFIKRRGSKKYIKGWKFLQSYMYEHNMINKIDQYSNNAAIYAFVYMPDSVRDFLYRKVLREKAKNR